MRNLSYANDVTFDGHDRERRKNRVLNRKIVNVRGRNVGFFVKGRKYCSRVVRNSRDFFVNDNPNEMTRFGCLVQDGLGL